MLLILNSCPKNNNSSNFNPTLCTWFLCFYCTSLLLQQLFWCCCLAIIVRISLLYNDCCYGYLQTLSSITINMHIIGFSQWNIKQVKVFHKLEIDFFYNISSQYFIIDYFKFYLEFVRKWMSLVELVLN